MIYNETIFGSFVFLKSADLEDASFTLSVRQDPSLTVFLPKLDISLNKQKEWISKQRGKKGDYFFVIFNKRGERIGTSGVYDVENGSAETGRLTSIGNPFESLEAQYLSFVFAFDVLKLKSTRCHVYKNNTKAIHLSEFFGTTFSPSRIEKNIEICDGILTCEAFKEKEAFVKRMLYRR